MLEQRVQIPEIQFSLEFFSFHSGVIGGVWKQLTPTKQRLPDGASRHTGLESTINIAENKWWIFWGRIFVQVKIYRRFRIQSLRYIVNCTRIHAI